MKFCKYCGAQLEDNAFCNCEKSRAAQAQAQQANAQAQPQYQQPVQPQQPQSIKTLFSNSMHSRKALRHSSRLMP